MQSFILGSNFNFIPTSTLKNQCPSGRSQIKILNSQRLDGFDHAMKPKVHLPKAYCQVWMRPKVTLLPVGRFSFSQPSFCGPVVGSETGAKPSLLTGVSQFAGL